MKSQCSAVIALYPLEKKRNCDEKEVNYCDKGQIKKKINFSFYGGSVFCHGTSGEPFKDAMLQLLGIRSFKPRFKEYYCLRIMNQE